jgi:hypothetical protein
MGRIQQGVGANFSQVENGSEYYQDADAMGFELLCPSNGNSPNYSQLISNYSAAVGSAGIQH